MLAAIMGAGQGAGGDEAPGMSDEAYKPLVGVGSRVVAVLDEGQPGLAHSGSNPDMRRGWRWALELLKAEADLYAGAGQPAEAAVSPLVAVALAGCLAARSERLLDHELAADLLEQAGSWSFRSPKVRGHRAGAGGAGRYADAEDALFELIDEQPDDLGPVEEAIAFCQRLRPLEPVVGRRGLTLEEVNDTLAELLRRQPVPDRGADDGADEPPFTWQRGSRLRAEQLREVAEVEEGAGRSAAGQQLLGSARRPRPGSCSARVGLDAEDAVAAGGQPPGEHDHELVLLDQVLEPGPRRQGRWAGRSPPAARAGRRPPPRSG